MKTSQLGIELIKQSEGFKPESYICPAGVVTIGYGTTKGVKPGMKVTEAEATALMMRDVSEIETNLNRLNLRLRQHQFDALVDFCYNLGFGRFLSSNLLKMVSVNPDSPNIPTEFRKWRIANGRPMAGLISRREAEIRLYYTM